MSKSSSLQETKVSEKAVTFRIPKDKYEELCRLVEKSGINASSLFRKALYAEMAKMRGAGLKNR